MDEIHDNVNHCFICLQALSLEQLESSSTRTEISTKFLTLVNRFLNVKRENSNNNCNLVRNRKDERQDKTSERPISVCCDLCFPNLKLFCNNYQQLELMQLKIVYTLRGISDLIQSQKTNLEQDEQIENCFKNDDIIDFRENFCARLENKRRRLFPEVSLERLKNIKIVDAVETEQPEKINHSTKLQDDSEIFPLSPQKFPEPEIDPAEPHGDHDHLDDDDFRCDDDNVSCQDNDTEQELKPRPDFTRDQKDFFTELFTATAVAEQQTDQGESTTSQDINPPPPNICKPTKSRISVSKNLKHKNVKVKKKKNVKRKRKVRNHGHHECLVCSRVYKKPFQLHAHLRAHLLEKVHHCRLCWKEFQRDSGLAVHKKLHHPPGGPTDPNEERPRPWVCEQCGKAFTLNRYLLNHQILHQEDRKRYECDICHKTYSDASSRAEHKRIVHMKIPRKKGKSKSATCDICEKILNCKRDLRRHKARVHGQINPFEFKLEQAQRNFKCPMENCRWAFYEQYDLDRHLLTHSGEKPFECDQCGRPFAQKSALKRHMESHSEVKSFLCKTCGHGFSQAYLLKNHEKIHAAVASSTSTAGMEEKEMDKLLS